ncbi:hypothetical protein TCAL_11202 [Tigriopus californicus]|uniref:Sulfotransferase domain-containing protein n=2 Tax=Tigriopus californicus TaxID=6832 RepID=A0A553PQ53_TIGCA|nr:hypothetical protein TCAL_11202 [Tigriopus californicus]
MPGTFYNFEPLISLTVKASNLLQKWPLTYIHDMIHCRTSQEFLDSSSDLFNEFTLSRNVRPWDACQFVRVRGTDENFCFNATMYNELCRLYPKRLVKAVRGKLADLKSLLIDKTKFGDLSSNLKIVVLLRDPRGIMKSRYDVKWCQDECLDEAELCRNLESNLNEAQLLAQTHPDQVYLLRYEDLCLMPEKHVVSLFQFLGQPVSQVIKKYTVFHMSTQDSDQYGTRRKAKNQAFLWTKEMSISDIRRVEGRCQNFMTKAGYVAFPHDPQGTDAFQFLTSDTELWNYTETNEHWFLA